MAMLGKKFPETQFMITGVLGPGSNAHGPNEFLHIPYGKKADGLCGGNPQGFSRVNFVLL